MTNRRRYAIGQARVALFSLWVVAFVVYVFLFLATSTKKGVTFDQASQAAWNVAYVLVPIITAFGSFWFSPKGDSRQSSANKKIDGVQLYAMFALTSVFHVIVLGYFAFAIFLVDFYDPVTPDISYADRVDTGIKWLMLLSAFAVLPVGFVLGGEGPSELVASAATPKGN
jgi:hypothetical protein